MERKTAGVFDYGALDGILGGNPEDVHPFLTTGIGPLDAMLGGGLRSGYYVVSGAPSSGKSTLACQIAHHCASSGAEVLYVANDESPALARLRMVLHGCDHKEHPAITFQALMERKPLAEPDAAELGRAIEADMPDVEGGDCLEYPCGDYGLEPELVRAIVNFPALEAEYSMRLAGAEDDLRAIERQIGEAEGHVAEILSMSQEEQLLLEVERNSEIDAENTRRLEREIETELRELKCRNRLAPLAVLEKAANEKARRKHADTPWYFCGSDLDETREKLEDLNARKREAEAAVRDAAGRLDRVRRFAGTCGLLPSESRCIDLEDAWSGIAEQFADMRRNDVRHIAEWAGDVEADVPKLVVIDNLQGIRSDFYPDRERDRIDAALEDLVHVCERHGNVAVLLVSRVTSDAMKSDREQRKASSASGSGEIASSALAVVTLSDATDAEVAALGGEELVRKLGHSVSRMVHVGVPKNRMGAKDTGACLLLAPKYARFFDVPGFRA